MMVNGIATKPEEKLEDIRNAATRRLLARYGREGLYLFDRLANTQCLLSWEALQRLQQDMCYTGEKQGE